MVIFFFLFVVLILQLVEAMWLIIRIRSAFKHQAKYYIFRI